MADEGSTDRSVVTTVESFLPRWVVVYFALYALPLPLDRLPFLRPLEVAYEHAMHAVVTWFGAELLGVDARARALTRSGDQLYYWVQVLLFAIVAGVLAAASFARRAPRWERLYPWLWTYLRLKLATSMFFYGGYKIFPRQFPPISLARLIEPYGESSPMGLLWNFMGASPAYGAFAGALEMTGGLLLLVPRLAAAGVLLCCGTMLNVVATNLCYDVPVKLHALHLLALAALLSSSAWPRLADVLVRQRSTTPIPVPRLFRRRSLERVALAVQVIFGVYVAGLNLQRAHATVASRATIPGRTPFYGIWVVDDLSAGDAAPAGAFAGDRWHRVVFQKPDAVTVQLLDGRFVDYRLAVDLPAKRLVLRRGQASSAELEIVESAAGRLALAGTLDGQPLHLALRRLDERQFPLLRREFRWVTERAFDR